MSFAKVYSAQVNLLSGAIVTIEVDLSRGLHAFSVVGLPDKAVDESKDRVSGAIKNSGFQSPKAKNQKIIVSLSPADLKKEGPAYDLPIAISVLASSKDLCLFPKNISPDSGNKNSCQDALFAGELALSGALRPINGILAIASFARTKGIKTLYLPELNAPEASLIEDIEIIPVKNLTELVNHLTKIQSISPFLKSESLNPDSFFSN